jgi:hypothetical protein
MLSLAFHHSRVILVDKANGEGEISAKIFKLKMGPQHK